MCTMIAEQIKIDGSGKGTNGWFTLKEANVSYVWGVLKPSGQDLMTCAGVQTT